ncbi:hypothetical protein NW768_002570 [Fusarium equiseti]|uniref:NADH:ubiquinone oxidoreductase intermediate-associated protein 30 domain-containing protein n=1 Tax=Fusarium equiseti TaxID=61235 RepID=A0ABQ8RNR2_FUSEQ|nr:hypothetical protein NW768_002570 [Fusarium equiseti]
MYIPNIAVAALALFSPWDKSIWTASDDTVRGGISQSYFDVLEPHTHENPFSHTIAKFYGHLDYETLGGSGFASQRTIDGLPVTDLTGYDRLLLEIPYSDGKIYTINIRDSDDQKDGSTLNWAYDFQIPATKVSEGLVELTQVVIYFKDLVPTVRGTRQKEAKSLDLSNIVGASIMIRSFETVQQGDFELRIKSVTALGKKCEAPKVEVSCESLCGKKIEIAH